MYENPHFPEQEYKEFIDKESYHLHPYLYKYKDHHNLDEVVAKLINLKFQQREPKDNLEEV